MPKWKYSHFVKFLEYVKYFVESTEDTNGEVGFTEASWKNNALINFT